MKNFFDTGYIIVKNLIEPSVLELLKARFFILYENVQREPELKIKVDGIGGWAPSYASYGDPVAETLLLTLGQKICNYTGLSLSPTYSFLRIYEKNDYLAPHTDRPACEVSVTIPVHTDSNKKSVIYISNHDGLIESNSSSTTREQFHKDIEERKKQGNYTRVELDPGDGLIYSGVKRAHWREPLQETVLCQIFLHFVQTNGEYKDYIFDKRSFLGINWRTNKLPESTFN